MSGSGSTTSGRFLGENRARPQGPARLLPRRAAVVRVPRLAAGGMGAVARTRPHPHRSRPDPAAHGHRGDRAVLSLSADARELYAKPVLVPFALLAVPGLLALRRGAAHAFWWFSILFPGSSWCSWAGSSGRALELGIPGPRHRHWLRLQPGLRAARSTCSSFVAALAYTAFWVWVLLRLRRSAERPLVAWARRRRRWCGRCSPCSPGATSTAGTATGRWSWRWPGSCRPATPASRATTWATRSARCCSTSPASSPIARGPRAKRDCDVLLVQGMRTDHVGAGPRLGADLGRHAARATSGAVPTVPAHLSARASAPDHSPWPRCSRRRATSSSPRVFAWEVPAQLQHRVGLLRTPRAAAASASRCTSRTSPASAQRYSFWDIQQRANRLSNALARTRRAARRPRGDHPAATARDGHQLHGDLPDGRDRGAAVAPVRARRARVPAARCRRERCHRRPRHPARSCGPVRDRLPRAAARDRRRAARAKRGVHDWDDLLRARSVALRAGRHAGRRPGADHLHQRHHRRAQGRA